MHKLYRTIHGEHADPVLGVVKGDIPEWVCGGLYRNGPGMYEVGEYKYQHMFDPLAMFQRFHIENKKVTYQNRYLQSENYKTNLAAQRIVVSGFGTLPVPDPCQNIFQRFLSYFVHDENDNTIVNFFPMKDELYSATESHFIHRIDPETLDTLDRVNLEEYVAVNSATAHPHYDPDGTLHNIGHSYKGGPKICLIRIPPKSSSSETFPQGEVKFTMKSSGKMSVNYLHSFAITENFYVYIEQPMFINIFKVLTAKLRGATIAEAVEWWPTIKARFRIVNKATGEEVNPDIRYEADPVMVFHHINAYEDNGHVVLDLVGFKTQDPLKHVYLKNLTSEECEAIWRTIEEPEPRRYVLPLNISKQTQTNRNLVELGDTAATAELVSENTVHCTWETLAQTGVEFPQINYPKFNGRKYRYFYGVGWHKVGKCFHTIAKIDTRTKTFTEWKEEKCYPSEPVFVPNPNGTDEDDGVILSAVNSSDFDQGKNAFLLVLDAKTMSEIARAEFPDIPRFPRDFHGMFRPDKS